MGFRCEQCGEYHDEFPMDIAYARPAEYFTVPEEQREQRIYFTEDFCVVDGEVFVIRGILPLPIKDSEDSFRWSVWAIVDERDFKRYLELWDAPDAESEPPFPGKLSGDVRTYPDSDLLPVMVHLRSGNDRPIFKVISEQHPLGIDQRQGITLDQAHDFVFELQEAKARKNRDMNGN